MHYLYRTVAKKEKAVNARLLELGCDTYLPLLDGEPLFPTYLFVDEKDANPYEMNRVPGSLGIVSFGPQQAMVPDSLVQKLRATEWQRSDSCTPGAKIRITNGLYEHFEAIVKAKKGERIFVLINLIEGQKAAELELKLNQVEAA